MVSYSYRSINVVGALVSPKRHHHVLVMSVSSAKGSLRYVLLIIRELMVARSKVCFRKSSCTLKLVKKVIYPGQKVTVLDSYLIKLSIIYI